MAAATLSSLLYPASDLRLRDISPYSHRGPWVRFSSLSEVGFGGPHGETVVLVALTAS